MAQHGPDKEAPTTHRWAPLVREGHRSSNVPAGHNFSKEWVQNTVAATKQDE